MPLLAHLPSGAWMMLTEARLYGSYCGSHLLGNGTFDRLLKVVFADDQLSPVQAQCPFSTPWRVVYLTAGLPDLVASTLVDNLDLPSEAVAADTSWIKPGRSSWSWWCGDGEKDTNVVHAYIDFAASMGWEYHLCDAGWNQSPSRIVHLCQYAKARGVKIIVWGNHRKFTSAAVTDSLFALWKSYGVAGVKIDLFDSDKQDMMKKYEYIALSGLKNKLLINFHGSKKPTGEERRWPHIMTFEAVKGAEWYQNETTWPPMPDARHNCTLPFTRNVLGPMDYTPFVFTDLKPIHPINTTWAHQVALPVVFESHITHFADRYSSYKQAPQNKALDFLKAVPASWDDTRLIEGYPGRFVTIARRNGMDWFIGVLCADTLHVATIPLNFLGKGTYQATIYRDADIDRDIVVETRKVDMNQTLSINLRKNGGCAIQCVFIGKNGKNK
jgi:alpha-glucosidase